MELFYHAEPFDVACDLAGNPLNIKDYSAKYLAIRDGTTSAPSSSAYRFCSLRQLSFPGQTRHAARDCFSDSAPIPIVARGTASAARLQAVAACVRQAAGESGTQGQVPGQ